MAHSQVESITNGVVDCILVRQRIPALPCHVAIVSDRSSMPGYHAKGDAVKIANTWHNLLLFLFVCHSTPEVPLYNPIAIIEPLAPASALHLRLERSTGCFPPGCLATSPLDQKLIGFVQSTLLRLHQAGLITSKLLGPLHPR
eukprot:1529885-Amphidinium_carterae.2